jgi:hypothetical protein
MKTTIRDIEKLQRKIIELEKKGPPSKYHIRYSKTRTVTKDQLSAFELEHKIELPKDLKKFLLHFGAAGMFEQYDFLKQPSIYYDSPFDYVFTKECVEYLLDNGVSVSDIENADYDVAKDAFNYPNIQSLIGSAKQSPQYVIISLMFGHADCGHTRVIILSGENKGAFGWYGGATGEFHSYKGLRVFCDEYEIIEPSVFDYEKVNLNAHINFLQRIANGEIQNEAPEVEEIPKKSILNWFRKKN